MDCWLVFVYSFTMPVSSYTEPCISIQRQCTNKLIIIIIVITIVEDEDICHILRKLDEEYQKWGLTTNTNKSEYIDLGNT